MARQPASPIDRIIDYFMTAPVAECTIALRTSQRIVNARKVEPAPVNATKARRPRRKKADPATASAAPAPTSGPTAVVPRRRRGRPPVTAPAQHTVPTALPVDAQGGSLPVTE